MKQIFLAKKGKRILARFIDLLILFGSTCLIFFSLIYPNIFNKNQFEANSHEIVRQFKNSELFIVDDVGNYSAKSTLATFKTLDDLNNKDLSFNNVSYKNESLTKSLYDYYTVKFQDFGGIKNLSEEQYKNEILKINSEDSNIKDYDSTYHKITVLDSKKYSETISFFLNNYETACKNLIKNSKINDLTKANQSLLINALLWILPVLFAFSFAFEFIVPVCSNNGETIAKHIFKLGLVTKEGYKVKKRQIFVRFLCYYFIDLLISFATFGGLFLITYTMMLFTKKRRCIHDFVSGTCVINTVNSIIFKDKKEETYYLNRNIRGY